MSSAEFGKFIEAEIAKWGPVVQKAGMKAEYPHPEVGAPAPSLEGPAAHSSFEARFARTSG